MSDIVYAIEPGLTAAEFRDILVRSTLGERRPVDNQAVMEGMVKNAQIIVTARTAEGLLIGVSRSLTDFIFSCYLSDLAVDKDWQHKGVGRKMVDMTHKLLGPHCSLLLLAAPAAADYYGKIGFTRHERCWWIPAKG